MKKVFSAWHLMTVQFTFYFCIYAILQIKSFENQPSKSFFFIKYFSAKYCILHHIFNGVKYGKLFFLKQFQNSN